MQDLLYGVMMYGISLLTIGGIYAILSLGLNLHWGMTGLFNAGIAGFFAIGAYTSTLLTTAENPNHFGGLNLPIPVGLTASMLVAGIVAFGVGKICLRLRSDYLAIATIGVAEILRLILKNEIWLTSGSRGIPSIPRPFEHLPQPWSELGFLAVVLVLVLCCTLPSNVPFTRRGAGSCEPSVRTRLPPPRLERMLSASGWRRSCWEQP